MFFFPLKLESKEIATFVDNMAIFLLREVPLDKRVAGGRAYRSPATKNCAPQATAVCGCGERQPTEVQWKASAREILLLDQG
ncbi:hypothetical protein NPIL_666501 [Nephila pilipes]|uniref:Uncharacterized protein n=1 Tax=Nephila pilipes TaxID=299642 RepID=A0A8X6UJ63_NEPPI|nr:hypothetical protein NPIL_666501 [Nephila pilipes]